MNRADRRISEAACTGIAAERRSHVVRYGSGLPSSTPRTRGLLLPGLSQDELMLELKSLVGIHEALTIEEATEAVRRMLMRLYPLSAASDEHYWSHADCVAVAESLLPSGSALKQSDVERENLQRCKPEKPLPLLPDPHPPRWLEWAQMGLYGCMRQLLNLLGLASRWGDSGHCRLHWYDSMVAPRDGDPTPLILIHGCFTSAASVAPIGVFLQQSRRVLAVDLPGMDYSWSTWHTHIADYDAPRPCSLAASIDAVDWLVDQLAPEGTGRQVDVLGHSFGANIALELARRSEASGRHNVRHVHLLAPGGASAARIARPSEGGSARVGKACKPSVLALLTTMLVEWLVLPVVMPIMLGIFASPNMLNLFYESSYVEHVRRRHAAQPLVSPPCQLIFAAWDDLVTPRPISGLRDTFPTAEKIVVRRGVHQLNVLNPATVCAVVEAFEERRGYHPKRSPPVGVNGRVLALVRWGLAQCDWLVGVVAEPMDERK